MIAIDINCKSCYNNTCQIPRKSDILPALNAGKRHIGLKGVMRSINTVQGLVLLALQLEGQIRETGREAGTPRGLVAENIIKAMSWFISQVTNTTTTTKVFTCLNIGWLWKKKLEGYLDPKRLFTILMALKTTIELKTYGYFLETETI